MPASRMETREGITVSATVGEVCCFVSGESSPLEPLMSLIVSVCALRCCPSETPPAGRLPGPANPRRGEMSAGWRWKAERDRRGESQGNLFLSLSNPVKKKKRQQIVLFSSSINTPTSHHVASHCNMISYLELQIDHSAHTGDGYNQSSGN